MVQMLLGYKVQDFVRGKMQNESVDHTDSFVAFSPNVSRTNFDNMDQILDCNTQVGSEFECHDCGLCERRYAEIARGSQLVLALGWSLQDRCVSLTLRAAHTVAIQKTLRFRQK